MSSLSSWFAAPCTVTNGVTSAEAEDDEEEVCCHLEGIVLDYPLLLSYCVFNLTLYGVNFLVHEIEKFLSKIGFGRELLSKNNVDFHKSEL